MYITVKELLRFCKQQIEKWNWDKNILISSDDEWNGYHWLFYQFLDDIDEIKELQDYCDIRIEWDIEDFVILG